jgi:hypothetical protein
MKAIALLYIRVKGPQNVSNPNNPAEFVEEQKDKVRLLSRRWNRTDLRLP